MHFHTRCASSVRDAVNLIPKPNPFRDSLRYSQNWLNASNYSRSYRLCVFSNVGEEWKRCLKTFLGWTRVGEAFDGGGSNPFSFKGVEFFSSFEGIKEGDDDRPVVLFGTSASLMTGPCAAALGEWGGEEDNGIIFTSSQFNLGPKSALLKEWCKAKEEEREMADEIKVKSWKMRRKYLEGEEVRGWSEATAKALFRPLK